MKADIEVIKFIEEIIYLLEPNFCYRQYLLLKELAEIEVKE